MSLNSRPRRYSSLLTALSALSALSALVLAGGSAGGCGSGATPASAVGPTSGGAVGDVCSPQANCRAGLACTEGKCAPSGATATGNPCQIGDECSSGHCGPARTCEAAGTGKDGDSCAGDADCAKGLRCGFDGTSMFPKCIAEGKSDFGQPCTSAKDCFEGLVCESGKCDAPVIPPGIDTSKGIPPYVPSRTTLPWAGATCAKPITDTGKVTALFKVPGSKSAGADDDFFSLPFPNDARRKSGRVDYTNFPHDPNPAFGFDAVKLYLDALATEPFGNYGTTFFRFDGDWDFSTVELVTDSAKIVTKTGGNGQLWFIGLNGAATDPTFGAMRGLSVFYDTGRNKYICNDYIAVRPSFADTMAAGTYAMLITKGVKSCPQPHSADGKCASGGSDVQSSADLTALLGAGAPADAGLSEAYTSYKPVRDYLAKISLDPANVLNAAVFTVGDPTTAAKHVKNSVMAAPAPKTTGWVLCKDGVKSPCPQADGARGCGTPNPAFDELHALVELPIFQKGTAPYTLAGGDIAIAGDVSTPITPVRTEQVCLSLTVPKGAPPKAGYPTVIYAHGTGGSFRSHATDGTAAALSSVDLGGTKVAFAVLGIDQIGHGPRRCGGGTCTSTASPNDIVFNFANPQAARFNYLQGAADQHALERAIAGISIDAAVTGTAITLDPANILFWGHSQGATEGAIFLAHDLGIKGAVVSGEGGSLIDALLTKSAPVDIKDSIWIALSESGPKSVGAFHPVLSLLQNWVDPADPLHFAALDVLPAVTPAFPRNLFQPSGSKDTYTPWQVQKTYLYAAHLGISTPVIEEPATTGAPIIEGNVTLGALKATAAFKQYAPASYDGHFVAFQNEDAKRDVTKFLARVASGTVPKLPE